MKIINMKKFAFVAFVFAFLILLSHNTPVFAQTEYQLLAPLPGTETAPGITSPERYITGVFSLLIGIAGVLAVIMIIVGGIKYMSTDAFSGKSEAKNTIQNAIGGLLLALGAWVILNSINPALVNFGFDQPRPTAPAPVVGGGGGNVLPGYPLTPEQVAADAQIRQVLSQNIPPVSVNNGPCVNGETQGCTNVVGLPPTTIQHVMQLATLCGCPLTITGGSEGGHETHGPGRAAIDLRQSQQLHTYLSQFNSEASGPRNGTRVLVPGIGILTYEVTSRGNHWHAQM